MLAPSAKPKLLVLLGPTAVGKTKLSLEIAQRFGCEIISGDSMQVYRGMDIGTAKASAEEQKLVPHHLIDICDPSYPFSAAEFQERVKDLILDIHSRGKLPFIVGGTGLYIESVCYNYQFTDVSMDEAFRQEQEAYAFQYGDEALHRKLREIDPASADRLHANDRRRIIRAMEIYHVSGETMTSHLASQKKESPYELCIIGLTMDRALLYKRIEERIDAMMQEGLVAEVQSILAAGCPKQAISMQALGYKEIVAYLEGELNYEEAVTLLKRDTRRFAKRQLSWFRHMKDIHWVDVTESANFSAHFSKISDILAGKFVHKIEYN
ncbi:tRNA (adenosine(37)-N6)-dimethylallyltransferase MiaA [Paenibacillus sp. GCM10023248]|uniref:tRNA (adenosine(37)-N6)-dimethylallyltransferase MiaA n=1 Tax=Bacillales TaxID=1385 RepID=UPI002378EB55|nr:MULTISPECIES: tRNA (adenosine(37)-N6)-dimethylallyltransferase MiaA [Bacillales]MDD9267784.1 tRNA (adenosine(37)-N6)-dimethylallyltransferase MiaA [Paenibacillus sp. MAHUQ-63]MDR6882245.1 tRNA dimethylallyltransferase [Bacillus sp. 3255]